MTIDLPATSSSPTEHHDDIVQFVFRSAVSAGLLMSARALLDGRLAPSIDDVLDLAEPVLKHRMALTFSARAEGETVSNVIARLKARIG